MKRALDPAFSYRGLKLEASVVENDQAMLIQPAVREKHHFALELDHFAKTCIMEGREAYTPGEEGLQDQRIMEAIYRSAKTRKPVKLKVPKGKDAFRGTDPEES
jgi:predicted dehydrogenase